MKSGMERERREEERRKKKKEERNGSTTSVISFISKFEPVGSGNEAVRYCETTLDAFNDSRPFPNEYSESY